eukprot:Gregarina_sp_Poly_1__6118@NODE_322_length_9532_cov_315_419546_g274_i0_p5_GENE_NODE_322_length_9532_cov_315_419546_g274_i0NODE_322_length_9532_cov_315_419546_g274_i0_p5_ORF_typecomplete_len288_score46_96TBCC/PF07986_12/2_1e14Vps54/PF07928_12/9_2e03Vps54/PF07928_12/0_21_NODE_322_length_9532_cov_315_419546_g274_i077838646
MDDDDRFGQSLKSESTGAVCIKTGSLDLLASPSPASEVIKQLRELQRLVARSSIPPRRKIYYRNAATSHIRQVTDKQLAAITCQYKPTESAVPKHTEPDRRAVQTSTEESWAPDDPEDKLSEDGALELEHSPRLVLTTTELASSQHLFVKDISNMTLILDGSIESLRVLRASNVVLIAPAVQSSASLQSVSNSHIVICCRQLRLVKCESDVLSISTYTVPVCETCTDLTVANFQLEGDPKTEALLQKNGMQSRWTGGSQLAMLDLELDEAKHHYTFGQLDLKKFADF